MTRIAVSGHRGLSPGVSALIDKAVRAELAPVDADSRLVGLTCLADGADQIFARAVLDLGGQIEVFVPAATYRDGQPASARPTFDELLRRAATVHRLDHHDSTSESKLLRKSSLAELVTQAGDERGSLLARPGVEV
jgi:hypothetical protein